MNKSFYERCKKVVAELDLSYEQGIARDVILNELDLLEKQAEDYQKRFNKAVKYIKEHCEIVRFEKENVDMIGKVEGIPLLRILERVNEE